MVIVSKNLGACALALVLAGCGALEARHAVPKGPQEPVPSIGQGSPGTPYRVDETQSELRILVYRAGPLARLGHNHVMVNRRLRGAVSVADAADAATFWLEMPSAAFIVDDARARAEEGPDFAADVPEEAKSGTLQNMLSASVLDAAEFPAITVRSVAVTPPRGAEDRGAAGVTGEARTFVASVAVDVAGHESTIEVPFAVQLDPSRVSASGTLELRQSALGLTPYSLMLGALQVQDAMTVKFKIVAVKDQGG
jgi:hypothetical protein